MVVFVRGGGGDGDDVKVYVQPVERFRLMADCLLEKVVDFDTKL